MKRIEINYGDRYNSLTILNEDEPYYDRSTGNRIRMVHCRCDCGNEVIIRIYDLRGGRIKTCGCSKKNRYENKNGNFRHGDRIKNSKHYYIYDTWRSVKQRCLNPNKEKFKQYREKGMYEPWINNYQLFKEYILTNLGERPKDYSLDRIQNKIGYFPDNLRWADDITQANNK